jgi:formate dehydrogenase major subunit
VNPLRGQNNVQGSCDMGSFPHELPGLPPRVATTTVREIYESLWGVTLRPSRACASPTCSTPRSTGSFKGCTCRARTSRSPTPTPSTSRPRCAAMECVVVQDLFLNETARFAHVFLPGHVVPREGRHLHQRRAPHQPGAAGHAEPGRQGRVAGRVRDRDRDGLPDVVRPRRPDHGRDRRHAPTFAGVSLRRSTPRAAMQWPVNEAAPHGTPTMHVGVVRARPRAVHADGLRADRPSAPTAASRCC